MDLEENRFAHLLKPIRELTKNWDIDVAAELNDYLEELDEMCITFDGGIQLNFAEAALLIQGSACIYSKKVELLYHLVYQTLDLINDRNKKRDKQAASPEEGGSGRAVTNHDTDNDAMFLSYDESVSGRSLSYTEPNTCARLAPLPPESLILPETSEKQKLPLISLKGEILASCKDFRMNTFIAGALGLIHLYLARDIHNDNSRAPFSLYQDEGGMVPVAGDAGIGGSDDIEDGGGDGGDNFLPLEDNDMEMEHGVEEHINRHQAPSEGRVLRERQEVQPSEGHLVKKREQERAHAANMWGLHDCTAMFGKTIPMKTGKGYKVPDGLDDAGKRKRKEPSVLPDFYSWFTGIYDPPERKLKNGPAFTDLNYAYLSKMKEKLRTRRRILRKKGVGVGVSDEELRRTYLQAEEEEQTEGLRLHNLQGADDDHSDDEHEPLPVDIPAEFDDLELEHLSYEDLVKKAVEHFLVNSQRYGQETALSLRVKEWEEKIRPELAMQEERPVFDIHDYGSRIVAAIGEVGHRRSFASIVHGMDNLEACKYMLASLQLANDYTVEVDRVEGLEETIDSMGLTLLSTYRAHERFKTRKASEATFNTS